MNFKDKIQKPWWCPKWAWNMAVDAAASKVKDALRPANVAQIAAQGEAMLLRKAVNGKDPAAVKRIMRVSNEASRHAELVTRVLEDGLLSVDEEKYLTESLCSIATGYVDDAAVAVKIDEIAKELKL